MSGVKNSDVEVASDDQQKINRFARLNNKLDDIKDEVARKKKDLQNLQDADDELVLMDESDSVALQMGDTFVDQTVENLQKVLEGQKTKLSSSLAQLEVKQAEVKAQMAQLKVELYAKFGTNINLEPDEET